MTIDGTLTCNQKDRDISLVQASNETVEECYCTTHMRENLKGSISRDRRTGQSVGGKCWEKSINNIGKRKREVLTVCCSNVAAAWERTFLQWFSERLLSLHNDKPRSHIRRLRRDGDDFRKSFPLDELRSLFSCRNIKDFPVHFQPPDACPLIDIQWRGAILPVRIS